MIVNRIGIDHQPLNTQICLREGEDIFAPIGNGFTNIIPNKIVDDCGKRFVDEILEDVPIYSIESGLQIQKAGLFWNHTQKLIYDYLGYLSPTIENEYEIIVATQYADKSIHNIPFLLNEAGLYSSQIIHSTEALLSRFLWENVTYNQKNSQTVCVVVLGDINVAIQAFNVPNQTFAEIKAVSEIQYINQTGFEFWLDKQVNYFTERVGAQQVRINTSKIKKSLIDLALRFNNAQDNTPQPIYGPWYSIMKQKRISTLVSIEQIENEILHIGPDLVAITDQIDAVLKLIQLKSFDKIILGGNGAIWPTFKRHLELRYNHVWQSQYPFMDIAKGATLYHNFFNDINENWASHMVAKHQIDSLQQENSKIEPQNDLNDPTLPAWMT